MQLHCFDNPALWHVEMNIWAEHQRASLKVETLPSWQQDPARLLHRKVADC